MTDHDPLDRDELVAAYLDGEATPAERAMVEADAGLMTRATVLRRVADMVAEPVMGPPRDVKRAHIAAALAASPTAPNVTALATRRKRMDMTKLAAVAAVVIAVLAVPIVLLSNGDDNDTAATGAVAADDTTGQASQAASGDDGTGGGGDELLADEIRTEEDADFESAAEPEAAAAAEPEPAEEPSADEPFDGGSEPAGESELALEGPAFARMMGELGSIGELADSLLDDQADDAGGAEDAVESDDAMPIEELACVFPYLELGGGGGGILTAFGTVTIADDERTFAQLDEDAGPRLVVFDVATCNIIFDDVIE